MRQTLGEQKEATCQICSVVFQKVRHDQKFCCEACRYQAKQFYKRVRWFDRPDRQEQNAKRREQYYANRPQILAKIKQWRIDNPEAAHQRDHKYYERYKEKYAARMQSYRKAHPEFRQRERRNSKAKYPWKEPLFSARNRALKKSLSFDLTYEWCEQNWTGKCALSGLPFKLGSLHHHPFSPSIDRIDSSKGYTQENCRFICYGVNSMKGVGTDDELFILVEALLSLRTARRRYW